MQVGWTIAFRGPEGKIKKIEAAVRAYGERRKWRWLLEGLDHKRSVESLDGKDSVLRIEHTESCDAEDLECSFRELAGLDPSLESVCGAWLLNMADLTRTVWYSAPGDNGYNLLKLGAFFTCFDGTVELHISEYGWKDCHSQQWYVQEQLKEGGEEAAPDLAEEDAKALREIYNGSRTEPLTFPYIVYDFTDEGKLIRKETKTLCSSDGRFVMSGNEDYPGGEDLLWVSGKTFGWTFSNFAYNYLAQVLCLPDLSR